MWSQLSTRPGPGVPCDGEIERQFQGEDHRGFVLNTRNRESGQGLEYRSSVTLCGPHSQSALSTVSSQLPAGVAEPEEQLELPKAGVCAHTCAVCVYVHVRVCVCAFLCMGTACMGTCLQAHQLRVTILGQLWGIPKGSRPPRTSLQGRSRCIHTLHSCQGWGSGYGETCPKSHSGWQQHTDEAPGHPHPRGPGPALLECLQHSQRVRGPRYHVPSCLIRPPRGPCVVKAPPTPAICAALGKPRCLHLRSDREPPAWQDQQASRNDFWSRQLSRAPGPHERRIWP